MIRSSGGPKGDEGAAMMQKLAIFDVDGTLVDSRAILKQTADAAFTALGLPPPPYDALRQIVGLSLKEGLAALMPHLDEAQVEALTAHYRANFHTLHRDPAFIEPLYEGAAALLDRLKREGWLIAMATGKSRRGVETIIEMHGWADLFDTTHCADDGPGKPHPAMVLEALKAMQTPADRAVMIGDTAHDVLMARAAGVYTLGVTWGFHTRAEIEASGADEVLDTFGELDTALDQFAARLG
jgi:phosphoglycolate phosphatase